MADVGGEGGDEVAVHEDVVEIPTAYCNPMDDVSTVDFIEEVPMSTSTSSVYIHRHVLHVSSLSSPRAEVSTYEDVDGDDDGDDQPGELADSSDDEEEVRKQMIKMRRVNLAVHGHDGGIEDLEDGVEVLARELGGLRHRLLHLESCFG